MTFRYLRSTILPLTVGCIAFHCRPQKDVRNCLKRRALVRRGLHHEARTETRAPLGNRTERREGLLQQRRQ
jgi:hypothetical protein